MSEMTLCILFLVVGLMAGGICGWIIALAKTRREKQEASSNSDNFVHKELYDSVFNENKSLKADLGLKEEERILLDKKLVVQERDLMYMEEKMSTWKSEVEKLRNESHTVFENIASRLLEEKSAKFSASNEMKINNLLQPLRENIKDFSQDIERRFTEEAKEKVSLRKELEHLKEMNQQLSNDAQLLASALKGDSKFQGDWGEFQLEILLEKAGLSKGVHFETQVSLKDDEGFDKRPDVIVNLPEGKHLVIDSKVSLKAYEQYFNAEKEEKKNHFLKSHLESLRTHVKSLGRKNYQMLYDIDSPDYVLLFVPLESAFSTAIQKDSKLFIDALDRNVVIVTSSTLLATMRTVSFIWKQEKQKKNVFEIARQSGMLYDKFVSFVTDLKEIGKRLDSAQSAWSGAMNKLSDSKKYGDTLVGRAEKIRQLGAKSTKNLPKELVE